MSGGANNGGESGDFARLEIETPFSARWLADFFADPEKLLRINPLMTFRRFEKTGPRSWRVTGRNEAAGRDFDLAFECRPISGGWRIEWRGWLKTATEVRFEPSGDGGPARLILIDDYSGAPEAERRRRIDEVDTSFKAWGQAIHDYLARWKRWSWLPGWKRYMGRWWLRMTPAARRISFIIIVLGAMEFALFLFVFAIFWLELPKYMN